MTEPRPDRRRQRTRDALLEAGIALFGAQAVDAVSIDEITAEADIAKGSFYNHFKDKDDLARAVTRAVRQELEDRVGAANAGIDDPAVRVARAISIVALFGLTEPDRAKALLRLHAGATSPNTPSNRGVRADVEAGLRTGRFAHCDVPTGMMAIMGTAQVALSHALDRSVPRPTRAGMTMLAAFLLRGLGLGAAAAAKAAAEGAEIFPRRSS